MNADIALPIDLTPAELAVLAVTTLWDQPISQTQLLHILIQSGAQAQDGKAFTLPKLKELLTQLQPLLELQTGKGYVLCGSKMPALRWLVIKALASKLQLKLFIQSIRQYLMKLGDYRSWGLHSVAFCQREILFATLCDQQQDLLHWQEKLRSCAKPQIGTVTSLFFQHPIGIGFFARIEPLVQQMLLHEELAQNNLLLADCLPLYQYCCALQDSGAQVALIAPQLAIQALLRADQLRLKLLLDGYAELCLPARFAMAAMEGQVDAALVIAEQHLKNVKKQTGKRKIFMPGFAGMIYQLLLLGKNTAETIKLARDHAGLAVQDSYYLSYPLLQPLLEHLATGTPLLPAAEPPYPLLQFDLDMLFTGYGLYWRDAPITVILEEHLCQMRQQLHSFGYRWVVAELDQLLQKQFELDPLLPGWHQQHKMVPLLQAIKREESWVVALKALMQLNPASGAIAAKSKAERVAWCFTAMGQHLLIEPKEQKLSAGGRWSKGKPIALKRLVREPETVSALTSQDKQVIDCIQRFEQYYGSSSYELDLAAALVALIGHPALCWAEAPESKLELVKAEVVLQLQQTTSHIRLQLEPKVSAELSVLWRQETPTKIAVYSLSPAVKQVVAIVANGLKVPVAAKAQLIEAIAAVAPVLTVHSDLPELSAALPEVTADPCLYAHLFPYSQGLRLQLTVRPLVEGSWFTPGHGSATLVGEQQGQAVQCIRQLKQEKTSLRQLLQACPAIASAELEGEQWLFAEPEHSLELLTQLKAMDGTKVQMVWPEGEKFRLKASRTLQDFSFTIKKQGDWFITDGEIQLDDHKVIALKELLQMLASSPGRFLRLSDDEYLALTESLRKRLAELAALGESSKNGLRFNRLMLPALSELTADVGSLKTDQAWQEQLAGFEALAQYEPVLPATLQTELRDYQLQGYQWLARLAQWGVGACLADDMGLGKTIQTLALLLQRAPHGPALVVAPVSVAMNWQAEVVKFAPVLQVRLYQQHRSLQDLAAFDLVITSYGMLQSDAELFQAQHWHTLVLDEAQAIKNELTKRSQAAMALQADFRMIATGTPVENHLGELWNLFRFINPGLLGSKLQFQQRFSSAIENGDAASRLQLKKLIQPFILRRTKTQVLSELPSRTEITLQVALSTDERHYYEALRQHALENLQQVTADNNQALQVLAEITKLRRFCCHPQLVDPHSGMTGSKLAVFMETVTELLDNKHKVLVFSQFVDHLAIVRTALERQHISYQYLVGSTPALERKKRVDAFQAGEGEVFLISLKAGGTGLNLTAADYVIHLDPWWNPAVEDQASDRAHRMGQTRPVTIYRLVTQNTIEEKIIALHQQKRDLADSLLEGGDMAARLDTAALLKLLKDSTA